MSIEIKQNLIDRWMIEQLDKEQEKRQKNNNEIIKKYIQSIGLKDYQKFDYSTFSLPKGAEW